MRAASATAETMTRAEHFSNPGRWLALCVTPYFADLEESRRHAGHSEGSYKIAPRRRCGAVTPGKAGSNHDEQLYIQSAYALPTTDKVNQEQASLLHTEDGFRKIIVAGDRYLSGYNEDGILMISLYDFLLGKVDFLK